MHKFPAIVISSLLLLSFTYAFTPELKYHRPFWWHLNFIHKAKMRFDDNLLFTLPADMSPSYEVVYNPSANEYAIAVAVVDDFKLEELYLCRFNLTWHSCLDLSSELSYYPSTDLWNGLKIISLAYDPRYNAYYICSQVDCDSCHSETAISCVAYYLDIAPPNNVRSWYTCVNPSIGGYINAIFYDNGLKYSFANYYSAVPYLYIADAYSGNILWQSSPGKASGAGSHFDSYGILTFHLFVPSQQYPDHPEYDPHSYGKKLYLYPYGYELPYAWFTSFWRSGGRYYAVAVWLDFPYGDPNYPEIRYDLITSADLCNWQLLQTLGDYDFHSPTGQEYHWVYLEAYDKWIKISFMDRGVYLTELPSGAPSEGGGGAPSGEELEEFAYLPKSFVGSKCYVPSCGDGYCSPSELKTCPIDCACELEELAYDVLVEPLNEHIFTGKKERFYSIVKGFYYKGKCYYPPKFKVTPMCYLVDECGYAIIPCIACGKFIPPSYRVSAYCTCDDVRLEYAAFLPPVHRFACFYRWYHG